MKIRESYQAAFTCSKLTRETLEQRCEICSKLTIKTPKRRQWPGVSIVNFEHVIAGRLTFVFTLSALLFLVEDTFSLKF